MRSGKRALAGVAAGALGLALVPMIGVTSAQAADYAGTTSPVRQTSTDGTSPNSVPYAKVAWAGNAADDTFAVTLSTGVAADPTISVSDTQKTSTYTSVHGVNQNVALGGTSDDTQLAILGTDDSYILISAKSAGTYAGTIQTYNAGSASKTVSFSFTTAGAASKIALTVNQATMAKDDTVDDFATVTVQTADGAATQLTSADSVAITSTGDDSGAIFTPNPLSYTNLAFSTGNFAIKSPTVAGNYTVTATPVGTLLPTGVTGDYTVEDNVLARTISMTSSTTVKNITTATPSVGGAGIMVPQTLSVGFNLTVGDTEAGNPVVVDITGTAVTASQKTVTTDSSAAGSFTVAVDPSKAVDGNTVIATSGGAVYTATFRNGVVYYSTVTRSPSAAVIVLTAGTTKDITFQVDDSYGVGKSGYIVTATSGTTAISATTDANGAATVALPDLSTSTVASVAWTFTVKNAGTGVAISGSATPLNLTLNYSATGDVSVTSLKFDATDPADFTTVQRVPYTGVFGPNAVAAPAGTLMAVTATTSVAGVEVSYTGGEGVWFCETNTAYTIGTDAFAAACTEGSMDYVASGTTVTGYVASTKTGPKEITLTSSSGYEVKGTATWAVASEGARNVTVSASPDKVSIPGTSTVTVTVTDVFGNGVALDAGTESVSLVTDHGTFGNGSNIFPISTTTSAGTASVSVMSSTAGLATITAKGSGGQFGDLVDVPFTGAAASIDSAAVPVEFVDGPSAQSIVIVGERGTVRGKPGIMVDGNTTGFAEGDLMVPWIKFPGQTEYSAGSARPAVDADGEFYWSRKTGKKIYVYFKNEAGDVKSDRIIIQAK